MDVGEWEQKLGGRIKSVLLVIFAAAAVILCAMLQEQKDQERFLQEQEQGANPIDTYFQALCEQYGDKLAAGTVAESIYRTIYLECWEQELMHAYECLEQGMSGGEGIADTAGTLTPEGELAEQIDQVRISLLQYLQTREEQESYQTLQAGSPDLTIEMLQRAEDSTSAQMTLVRGLTLCIYELLEEQDITSSFQFQPERAEEMLKNSGWLFSP